MNAWWVGPELVYGIKSSSSKVIFTDSGRLRTLTPHSDEVPELALVSLRTQEPVIERTINYDTTMRMQAGVLPAVRIDSDADAYIFSTSGNTGHPRDGCLADTSRLRLAFAATSTVPAGIAAGKVDPKELENASPSIAIVTTPLFHVTANNCVAQGTPLLGGKLVHMYRWDAAGRALEWTESERITSLLGVPVMARE